MRNMLKEWQDTGAENVSHQYGQFNVPLSWWQCKWAITLIKLTMQLLTNIRFLTCFHGNLILGLSAYRNSIRSCFWGSQCDGMDKFVFVIRLLFFTFLCMKNNFKYDIYSAMCKKAAFHEKSLKWFKSVFPQSFRGKCWFWFNLNSIF